jgi:hypothetical protein
MKLRERVIDLSARIAALRAEIDDKRTELVGMERELDALLNQRADTPLSLPTTPPPITPPPAPKVQTVAPTGPTANGKQADTGSIGKRIKAILEAETGGEYTSEDFERMMPGINVPSIRAALARMADDETIKRTRRGYYQAKTQA